MSEDFDRLAGLQHAADQRGLGLGIGLLCARSRQLRGHVTKLLRRKRGVVVADEKIRSRAISLDFAFGLDNLFAQGLDLPGQHLGRALCLILFDLLQQLQIAVRNGVGDLRRELRVLRREVDDDDAGFIDRINRQTVIVGFEHTLFRRHAHRISHEPDHREQRTYWRSRAKRRIEFGALIKLELIDDLVREVARQDKLRLACHRLLIDGAVHRVFVGIRAKIDVVAPFNDHARLGLISRCDDLNDDQCQQSDQNRRT